MPAMRATFERHVVGALASLLLGAALMVPAHAQSATSPLVITATVVNSCSFDSTATELLSITCSMQTPVAAATAGAPAASGGAPAALSFQANAGTSPPLSSTKFCNFLATEQLENASFNQFALDVSHHTAGPASYYSTMQVCF
jgi:hypothetical protein